MSGRYDDIIDLPHHHSAKHPHMSMTERAAQFSPFAALTGYGEVIAETARLTEERRELTEEQKEQIDRKLNDLLTAGASAPRARFTYFERDPKKEGGHTAAAVGRLIRYDPIGDMLVLEEGLKIPLSSLIDAEPLAEAEPFSDAVQPAGEDPTAFTVGDG